MTWFPVPEKVIRENTEWNHKVLTPLLWQERQYIESQQKFSTARFGKGFTLAYGGCGPVALYNAMLGLGRALSAEDFLLMLEELQRKGASWFGKFGTHPTALLRYFQGQGLSVIHMVGADDGELKRLEQSADVWVVTVFNGKKLSDQLHIVSITKTPEGQYVLHNAYGKDLYATLGEAISHISAQGATPLYTIGVRK